MGWFGSSKKKQPKEDAVKEPIKRTNKANELFVNLKQVPTSCVAVVGERGSGKSLMSNLICREPIFPLEGHGFGVTYASTPITWQEISEMYGLKKGQTQSSAVLFAEYGTDKPPEALHVLPLMRVATVIVVNTFLDPDPYHYLQTWFGFVPYISSQMDEKGYRQFGELMVVIRDWNEIMPQEDYTSMVWNYEQMPNIPDSDEERRNVIRYHIQRVFKAINMYFLPFPVRQSSQLKSRVFQTKALTPEFTNKFSELTFDLLERIRQPKAADNGEILMGKHINHITNTFDPADNNITFDDLAELYSKAVTLLHEEHGVINFRRHLQHLKELIEYHLTPPLNPDTLDQEFDSIVQKVEGLLRGVLHVSTPIEVRDRLCTDLWSEARPILNLLREENTAVIRDLQADFVRHVVVVVEREWEILAQNPRQKEQLKQLVEEKLDETFEKQIDQSKFAKIITPTLKEELFADLKSALGKSYSTILEINDDSCEQLIEKEKENVIAQANVKFRELQWQSRDHPFTNRELIHLISKWIDDIVASSKKKLSKQLDAPRLDSYGKQLGLELRQLSSSCVLSNLDNANNKINGEVEECLDFYRHQVLGPQLQACVINVAAQTRELVELHNLCLQNPRHLASFQNLKTPQDFLQPFKALSFLERTFIYVLLERAEFLCSVSDLGTAHARQKVAGGGVPATEDTKTSKKNDQTLALMDHSTPGVGGGRRPSHLGGNKRGGSGAIAQQQRQQQMQQKGKTADQNAANDWLNIPAGAPYMELNSKAPSQKVMEEMLGVGGGQIVPLDDNASITSHQDNNNALAIVHAPGVDLPETFSQFKVLSAEIIDRIWEQLKSMIEEDSADLVRRQRQRDERYRLLMKLMPQSGVQHQTEAASQKTFEQMYRSEMVANAPPVDEHQQMLQQQQQLYQQQMQGTMNMQGGMPLGGMNHMGQNQFGQNQVGGIQGQFGQNQIGQNQMPETPHGVPVGSTFLTEQEFGVQQQMGRPPLPPGHNQAGNVIPGTPSGDPMMAQMQQLLAQQQQSGQANNQTAEEMVKLRELINQQQSTLLSQQQALAEATRALEEVRKEKDLLQQMNMDGSPVRSSVISRGYQQEADGGPPVDRKAQYQEMKMKMLERLTAAKKKNKEEDTRKTVKGQNIRTCVNCKKPFNANDNNPRSCKYHKGRWVTAPNRGKSGMFAKAAVSLMMAQSGDDPGDMPEVGKWTCCGSKDVNAPGCVIDRHSAMERMKV